ncbi:MAG: PASTA domain-containing protein [Elusimicrobiota bacterium]
MQMLNKVPNKFTPENILKTLKEFFLFILLFVFLAGGFVVVFNWLVEVVIHRKTEVMVPDLKGKSLLDALRAVSQAGLSLREEREQINPEVPPGAVISQSPVPGILVREGKVIQVIISQGGEKIFVPDLIGQPIRAAELSLRNLGLAIGSKEVVYSTDVPKGIVLKQDPLPGTGASKGDLVNFVVCQGPPGEETILLPDFANREITELEAWALEKDLAVDSQIEIQSVYLPHLKEGIIVSQTPAPNTTVDRNTKIIVTVAGSTLSPETKVKDFYYEVSQGSVEKEIKIILSDKNGERTVYQSLAAPGSKLNLKLAYTSPAKMKIFVNAILMEEKELEE